MTAAIRSETPMNLGAIHAGFQDAPDGYATSEQHFLTAAEPVGRKAGYGTLGDAISAARHLSAGEQPAVAVSQKYGVHDRFVLNRVDALKLWQVTDTGTSEPDELGKYNVDGGYAPYDFSAVAKTARTDCTYAIAPGFTYPRYEFWGIVDGRDVHRNAGYDPV